MQSIHQMKISFSKISTMVSEQWSDFIIILQKQNKNLIF